MISFAPCKLCGWRMIETLTADGADGGMFAMGKAETLCLVSRRQPA